MPGLVLLNNAHPSHEKRFDAILGLRDYCTYHFIVTCEHMQQCFWPLSGPYRRQALDKYSALSSLFLRADCSLRTPSIFYVNITDDMQAVLAISRYDTGILAFW